jgi:hypothetical protein
MLVFFLPVVRMRCGCGIHYGITLYGKLFLLVTSVLVMRVSMRLFGSGVSLVLVGVCTVLMAFLLI